MRRLLTPHWIVGHLVAVAGIVAFVLSGFWQLDRLEGKRDFNASVEAAVSQEAVPITGIGDEAYRRVTATGSYDPGAETLVLRSRETVSGHHVLTPMTLADGRVLLVDRGWVPITFDAPGADRFAPPPGEVAVEGVLWPPEEGSGGPDRQPEVVRRIDPEIQEAFLGIDLMPQYLVLLDQDPPQGEYPIAEAPPRLSEGPHLGYAVQWFLFAGVVLVGYPILLWRTATRDQGESDANRSNTTPA